MAIKGLTDRQPQFPCIGELRKGEKKPDDKHIGKDLGEAFRFTTKDEAVAAEFGAVYGDRPASVHVYLPFASAAANFEAWQEEWVAGGLKHRCDGVECVLWYDDKAGKYSTTPKACLGKCKQVGRLRVIIPELRRLAYVTVMTTSKHDILNLTGNLLAYESLRGDLRGIPFVLHRTKRNISTPSGQNGQRARRDKWLLTIEPMPQWVELQLTAQERAATPLLEERTGGVIVDNTTGEIIRGNGGGPEWFDEDEQGDPEPIEEPPAPEPPKAAAPTKDTSGRPYAADLVQGYIRKKSGVWARGKTWADAQRDDAKTQPPTEPQVHAVAAIMAAAVTHGGMSQVDIDHARHAILLYCCGVDSTGKLSGQEARQFIELWKSAESWEPNQYAAAEAAAVVTAWQLAQGQLTLTAMDAIEALAEADQIAVTYDGQEPLI